MVAGSEIMSVCKSLPRLLEVLSDSIGYSLHQTPARTYICCGQRGRRVLLKNRKRVLICGPINEEASLQNAETPQPLWVPTILLKSSVGQR